MVISKGTAVVHPRPCIKEAMMPQITMLPDTATLPRVRTITRRAAELPSLRYGPRTSFTISGPLRVARQSTQPLGTAAATATLPRKYTRSYTAGVVDSSIRMQPERRVRFDLPPSDDSDSPDSPPFASAPRSRPPAFNRSRSRQSPSRFAHSLPQCVTVVCGTTSVRERAHPVGTYVRGTLAPTANAGLALQPPGGTAGALLKAAKENDEDKIRDLLRDGKVRDANIVDSSGRTALSYVASNGSVDVLESILQLPGIDPNLPDNEGNTPLHFAAQAGQVECLNFLLSRCQGLEIDARNHLGFTPLMKAALQGRNKCAKLLLFAGANPTLRDGGRGLRAEQWARYCGRYVCADVIEKFARPRLLERGTSCGRWGSDSDIGGTRLVLGKALPLPPSGQTQNHSQGIKSKLRKVFRTSSGPSNSSDHSSSARLVTQLTSAALCASSPVLPAAPTVPPVVKSLIRPLTVPRLQITLANGAATVTSDLNSLNMLFEQDSTVDKPPRIKKKMK